MGEPSTQFAGPEADNENKNEQGRLRTDSARSRRRIVPGDTGDGTLAWWGAWFHDPSLERAFQRANMAGARQYLMLLAAAGIIGALATAHGAWLQLPPDSMALILGNAWRGVLALAAVLVIFIARSVDRPWQLYACNAVVLAIGYGAVALRSTMPPDPGEAVTIFHVTQNGIFLLLVLTTAQLVLVPGWFVVNATISAAALVGYLVVLVDWPGAPYNAWDVALVGSIGFLFILGMGYSAQRMRRDSFLARARLQAANRELERLATLDHLTGCANRRHFYELAEAELARSRRYGRSMGLLIMDVDHFKAINDRFGHAAGDAVLRTLAEALREALRELDVLGRIGGEEFAVLLPETPRHEAISIAERLRRSLGALRIEYEGNELGLTASFGVTAREPGDIRLDPVMRRADRALYEAKAAGRNCTAVADSDRTASVAHA